MKIRNLLILKYLEEYRENLAFQRDACYQPGVVSMQTKVVNLDALIASLKKEPAVLTLGIRGRAYDTPEMRRAYTYEHQPMNVEATLLGEACNSAAKLTAGDNIDRGLGLLKELQVRGFGVFEIGGQDD